MDDKQIVQQEQREKRRKRRIRNQILSYLVVVIFLLGVSSASVYGVKVYKERKAVQIREQEETQAVIEEMLNQEEEELPVETPEPTPEPVVELTDEQKLDEIVNAGISVMPIEDKVAGLFFVTPESITGVSAAVKAGTGTEEALVKYAVGGIIYSEKNMQSKDQFAEMVENTRLFSRYPLFLGVQEEGGSMSALAKKGLIDKVESAGSIGSSALADNAHEAGVKIGTELAGLGLNVNFAPVADVKSVEACFLKDRTYGDNKENVGNMVAAMVEGLEGLNISSCLKHFPGIGSVTKDPGKGLSSTERSEEEFRSQDFSTFLKGIEAGADMVMISTVSAPGITGNEEPCVFSERVVTDILRGELGYDGIVITDALNMKVISDYYGADEAAVMALKAGCDMILMPEDFEKAYEGVINAVKAGTISEERINDSLRRIYRIKYADKLQKEE